MATTWYRSASAAIWYAPRVPEVRKPVDHHDERALAERRVVNLHAALGHGVARA